jgi:hypothetical protein
MPKVKTYLELIDDIKRGVHAGHGLNSNEKELAIQKILYRMANPIPRPRPDVEN